MNFSLSSLPPGVSNSYSCASTVGSPGEHLLGRRYSCGLRRWESVTVRRIGNRNHKLEKSRCRRLVVTACSLELPLLPFSVNEVLVPSESKVLHLYEARYIALLEESLSGKKLFVHFVLDPIVLPGSSEGESFAARYGCLVLVENVKKLEVGALVTIRGICRVRILNFLQAEPYLRGLVTPQTDNVPQNPGVISSKVLKLNDSLRNLNAVEIKLKSPKESPLQTNTANSLTWVQKEVSMDCDERFIPSLAERVSFAGYQSVTGSTQSELLKLQQEKLRAMEWKETMRRLDRALELVKDNTSLVAAKLAIQSLEIQ
ncbi:hypothetical protein MLD38_033714 [Melastoma candidum]|uniref:Uncharacterized protein n=1 Tax=Melastoma candidum TaxID=119954 RepID=A0ACB9M9Y4_9MYRT|nr:hypothetical protein MLD38_033714 [Melastoma candidum]